MKKLLSIILAVLAITACSTDDAYNLDYFTQKYGNPGGGGEPTDTTDTTHIVVEPDTVFIGIAYEGATATLTGDVEKVTVSRIDADITLTSTTEKYLQLTLSGSTPDGSLLVYSQKAWGLVLNGVSITNPDGSAINNQCSKWLYVTLADSTENTLTDGESYAAQAYDQKGTFFSEGQMRFTGTGKLTVNGNAKSGIVSDDYIVIDDGSLVISAKADGGRGIKVNDGLTINGGNTTITTTGDCKIETVDGVRDTTSAAGIKTDSLFTMTGGSLTITSKGDGGKGINATDSVVVSGGTLNVTTTGSNDESKPKGVKSDKAIVVSGGSFTVNVKKSWACDNGTESEEPEDHLTIVGTPAVKTLTKRSVVVQY